MVTQAQAFKIIAILIGLFLIATGFDKIVHFSDFIRSLAGC